MNKYYIKEEGETLVECVEAHCGNYFDTWEEALSKAHANVSPGACYSIVNEDGKTYATGITSEIKSPGSEDPGPNI